MKRDENFKGLSMYLSIKGVSFPVSTFSVLGYGQEQVISTSQ